MTIELNTANTTTKLRAESVHQFLSLIEEIRNKHMDLARSGEVLKSDLFLLRGQDEDFSLLPKIARYDQQLDLHTREEYMLHELGRRGSLYRKMDHLDEWDLLTLAQHNGMATRLLDWSTNPLTALWFACENTESKTSSFVYILRPHRGIKHIDRKITPTPKKHIGFGILKPRLEDPRVIAQDGWFTVHTVSRKYGKIQSINEVTNLVDGLVKIEIPAKAAKHVLKSLDILGVNHQTIYPDISGVCSYINWKSSNIGSSKNYEVEENTHNWEDEGSNPSADET